jgi:glycerol-3-phosphate cytidylyltransferase-like family protein
MKVLTSGVFDLGMHYGHFNLLLDCSKIAGPDGEVIVAVNSDESAFLYKRKPVFSEMERVHGLCTIPLVTKVVLVHSEKDIEQLIEREKIDFYVKGDEWCGEKVTGEDKTRVLFVRTSEKFRHHVKMSTSFIISSVNEYSREINQEDNSECTENSSSR